MKKTILLIIGMLFSFYLVFAIDAPSNDSPGNGVTNMGVQLTLDWTAVTGNSGYIYQLDTVDTFDSPLLFDGTSSVNSSNAVVYNLYFGQTYYWRAATKSAVDTSAWSSSTSFTTRSSFVNVSPSNGAVNQPVQVNIDWSAIVGNSGYIYEVDTVSTFDSPYLLDGTSGVNSSEANVYNLYFGTTYYWRAAAKSLVDTSEWSATWNFTTIDYLANSSPSNGATNQLVYLTLDWSGISGNNGYIYKIDSSSGFDSPLLQEGNSGVNSSQIDVSNLHFGTTYYWQAAVKSLVDTSNWSSVWSFTTRDYLTLTSPANATTNQNVYLQLDWYSLSGVNEYDVECDTSLNFDSPLYRTNSTVSSYFYQSTLNYGSTYYWRVRGRHASDTTSWSETRSFSTKDYVTLVSPTDGLTNQNVYIQLDWYEISGSNSYQVELDTVSSFDSPENRLDETSFSYFYESALRYGTEYFWRVRACHLNDTTEWSVVRSLSTKDYVTLVAPTDGLTNQNVYIQLDWYEVSGSNSYQVELDTVSTFDSPENRLDESFNSYFYEISMLYGTEYFWRVRACHVNDTSEWSVIRSFTTKDYVTLVSPSDGATNQDVYIQLDWSNLTGSNSYQVELDTVSTFDSPENRLDDSFNSYFYESGLRFGTEYFWRVRACHVNDTSEWSVIRSFTTRDYVTLVSPADGATGQYVYLQLDWSNFYGASTYEWELDTISDFSSVVLQTDAIANSYVYVSNLYYDTEYFWRVRAINAADTSGWSSIRSFTTVSTISNVSPANGSTNISINPNLDWVTSSGASGYLCEIDTAMNFNSSLLQAIDPGTASAQVISNSLLYGTTYYWHAAARNTVDTCYWSTTWSFTTAYELTDAPILVSPVDLSVDIAFPSTGIEWTASTGAVSYQYQYSEDATFATGINSYTTSLVTGTLTGLYPHTTYYWRVRGTNANGYSPWSTIWEFTTESAALTAPILVSPTNNALNVDSDNVTIDWNSVFGASAYIYEITEDENFISGVTTQEVSVTYKDVIGLANATQYFWRVKSTDGAVESDWSEVWNFTTQYDVLDAPVLVSPVNNSTEIDFASVSLDWNSVVGASVYTYEYSTDISFVTSTVLDITSDSNITFIDLEPFTTYYWRVKAGNGVIESVWSEVWDFTTEMDVLETPILVSPANNSLDIDFTSVTLDWNGVTDATEYYFEYSTDISFITDIVSDFDGATEAVITSLTPNTQYFWRVKAASSEAESAWSEVWSFTTIMGVLDIPVLVSPANNSIDIDFTSVTLDWNSVADATEYYFEYSTDISFISNVVSDFDGATEAIITSLTPNTQYYWRVKAASSEAESEWSEVWSFTTGTDVQYTLTITVEGGGIVYVDGVEYIEPVVVNENTTLTLLADFPLDWPFVQWIGDLTGSENPTTILMDGDKNITAEFVFVDVNDITEAQNYLDIYPNPSDGMFVVEWDNVSMIEIYDITGKLIYSKNAHENRFPIDISDSKPGMYLIKAYSENDSETRKIIIE